MKILVADDNPNRYQELLVRAEAIGIPMNSFDFSIAAQDIRNSLTSSKQYDLMILDLLLPMWPSDQNKSTTHSIDLMRELNTETDLNKPKYVIGITVDESLQQEHSNEFNSLAWTLLPYDSTSSDWLETLVSVLTYINDLDNKNDIVNSELNIDLAIVCALHDPELNAVLELPWNWSPAEPMDSNQFFYRGNFSLNERTINVVATAQRHMGMVASSIVTSKIVNIFNPNTIVMTGICAGIEGEVNMGDIIFADTVWDYQAGKYIATEEKSGFEINPTQVHADQRATSAMVIYSNESQKEIIDIAEKYRPIQTLQPTLHIGPVASGSAVIADEDIIESIVKQNRKLLGVEMEIYGVYSSCFYSDRPAPSVYAIKSVCDFANSSKNGKIQSFCAYMSAEVLYAVIQKYPNQFLNLCD